MKTLFVLTVMLSILIVGCAQDQSNPDAPANAIERYLEAVISKNNETFAGTFCSDFEFEAQTEFDSFGAVEASIEDMVCTVASMSDQEANVNCTGSIEVIYDGENNNTLDLGRFPYSAVQEDGEWKMCGYAS